MCEAFQLSRRWHKDSEVGGLPHSCSEICRRYHTMAYESMEEMDESDPSSGGGKHFLLEPSLVMIVSTIDLTRKIKTSHNKFE